MVIIISSRRRSLLLWISLLLSSSSLFLLENNRYINGVVVVAALRNGHDLPALGWNSWVKYGCNVSESLIKEQANALLLHGLDQIGFRYMNIDE